MRLGEGCSSTAPRTISSEASMCWNNRADPGFMDASDDIVRAVP
jgi:hypothetical protein